MTTTEQLLLKTPATRPCVHRRAHEHGTVQRYQQDRCRCLACRVAIAAYRHRRHHQIGYGRWSAYVDARPVRAHVQDLMRAGAGRRTVAELADISPETLKRLLYGTQGQPPATRMLRRTATALLALGIGRRRPASQGRLWDA